MGYCTKLWGWRLLWLFCCMSVSVAEFSGPIDTLVLQGESATLFCSNPTFDGSGVTLWTTAFANEGGVFLGGKYDNFEVIASSTTPITQLDLRVNNADVTDEGEYSCTITPDTGTATLQVEIQVTHVSITVDGATTSPTTPVTVREGAEITLVCTAIGARPQVSIDWTNDGATISGDTEVPTVNGDTTDTTSTQLFTPTRNDSGHRLMCETSGQQAAPSQSQSVSLNVQYPPDVTVTYNGGMITCSADANSLATSYMYVIILNGTEVLQTFPTSGQSVVYEPEYCTTISCNATNTIGTRTGTGTIADPVCPHIGITTTILPARALGDMTTSSGIAKKSWKCHGIVHNRHMMLLSILLWQSVIQFAF